MAKPIIQLENISKDFFGIRTLSEITLAIPEGGIVGLIGENGAGKSTLMNIVGGVIQTDQGSILHKGRHYKPTTPADAAREGIAFIHQELNLFGNLNIIDNLFIDCFPKIRNLGLIHKGKAKDIAEQILRKVGLNCSVHTLVNNLTPGEQQLVEIAKALSRNSHIIIFDEPTSSLTQKERDRLFELMNTLRESGCTQFFISHNLDEVLQMSDQMVVLRDGHLVSSGPKTEYTVDRMITEMIGRQVKNLYPPKTSRPSSEPVLEVKELSQRGIVDDISFKLHKGEILGLFGLMGSGRSELARILFGLDPQLKGEIHVQKSALVRHKPAESIRNGLAFVTENRRDEGLLMEAGVESNISLAALRQRPFSRFSAWVNGRAIQKKCFQAVEDLCIQTADLRKQPAKNLSGGNQQKVVIAKWLLTNPKVLILDEPTRGIDVGAKYEVYSIIGELASKGTGILCISSELEELIGICDRILVMSNGRIHGRFEKSEFEEKKLLHAAFEGLISSRANGNG